MAGGSGRTHQPKFLGLCARCCAATVLPASCPAPPSPLRSVPPAVGVSAVRGAGERRREPSWLLAHRRPENFIGTPLYEPTSLDELLPFPFPGFLSVGIMIVPTSGRSMRCAGKPFATKVAAIDEISLIEFPGPCLLGRRSKKVSSYCCSYS